MNVMGEPQPGIVTLRKLEEADGIRFLTMEHVSYDMLLAEVDYLSRRP